MMIVSFILYYRFIIDIYFDNHITCKLKLFTVIVASGIRKTSTLNNVFTTLNLLTVGVVVISGFFFGMYIYILILYL